MFRDNCSRWAGPSRPLKNAFRSLVEVFCAERVEFIEIDLLTFRADAPDFSRTVIRH